MGLFDRWFGINSRKQRLYESEQLRMQQELLAAQREAAAAAERQRRIDMQNAANEAAAATKEVKARSLDDAIIRLGGAAGYRSLLSGRKGGGGFGARGMLDAA